MKKLLIIISLFIFTGCSNEMITYKEAVKMNDAVIIDVRENVEYKSGHILNAINIPLGQIEDINLETDNKIIVYCRSGNRSHEAYLKLKDLGYKVYDLGSIDNWKGNIVEED